MYATFKGKFITNNSKNEIWSRAPRPSSQDWQVGSNIRGVGAKTGKGGREVEDMAPHYLCLWTSSNFTARAIERTSLRPRRDKGGASARRNKTENGHAFSPSSQI